MGLVPVQSVIWVHVMGEMKPCYPIYFQGPGAYHAVSEWAEGTWTGLLVSHSHLPPRPSPMPDSLGQRLARAGSWPGGLPWLPEEPDGTICSGDFSPDG